jgi:putative flippase GtrA
VSHEASSRLLKFSLVGAIGIGVQLSALAALSAVRIPYLPATALAVESAVIHNFLWHRHFTWADRSQSGLHDFLQSLLRFQVSNGLISLVSNLVLMRMLVGHFGLPMLPSNMLTIGLCFAANFMASDQWVFRRHELDSLKQSEHMQPTS